MADLIDRDALLKDLRSECPESDVCFSHESCIDCIVKRQPVVNRWIPCSERLPEYGEYVLFIRKNCEVYVGYYDEKDTWNTDYQWFIGENVTHWMYFPEPPEKE